jgi:hypothetical protein
MNLKQCGIFEIKKHYFFENDFLKITNLFQVMRHNKLYQILP